MYSYSHESDLFKFFSLLELFHVVDVQLSECSLVYRFFCEIANPSMLEGLICCEPSLWLDDQLFDKVLGVVGNFVPFFAIKVKFSLLNHLKNFLVIVTVEWWVSAKENV